MKNPRTNDPFSQKAMREGYPARSVYKLKEIDEKFHMIRARENALDLGAAPGSWSLYTWRRLKEKGKITAVDLSPLSIKIPLGSGTAKISSQKEAEKWGANENFVFIQGDIFDPEVKKKWMLRAPFSLVISDAAPKTTGNRIVDTGVSETLVQSIVSLLPDCLAAGGNFVAKVFEGSGKKLLEDSLKKNFETLKIFRPKAVRPESFEFYFVGLGFKGTKMT